MYSVLQKYHTKNLANFAVYLQIRVKTRKDSLKYVLFLQIKFVVNFVIYFVRKNRGHSRFIKIKLRKSFQFCLFYF